LYEKEDDKDDDFSVVRFSAPAYSKVYLRVFLWTTRQYHPICMLGLVGCSFFGRYPGIITMVNLKFPLPSICYRILWKQPILEVSPNVLGPLASVLSLYWSWTYLWVVPCVTR